MKTERKDVYSQVTNSIIKAIEEGAGEWQMPWHRSSQGLNRPVNVDTSKSYRGINIVSLWASAHINDFSTGIWGTYRQWQKHGCQVRKGQKSSLIVFYKEYDMEETNEAGEDEQTTRLVARASAVFNADQVDGFNAPEAPQAKDPAEIIDEADAFVKNTGATIHHGGNRAYYRPSDDVIQMPERDRFIGSDTSTATEAYWSTLLHELTHWTGVETRCHRQFGKRFGDDAYAMEELVAELGAAFLCADLSVTLEPRADHGAYIDHWLSILKADKKAIFTAASAAAKATDFMIEMQPKLNDETT